MKKSLRQSWVVFALLALYSLYYLIPLPGRLLWQPDETRYAEVSWEMLHTGNWIVPKLLGLRYFEKPIAGYWINNIGQWLFGHNNFGVRIGAVFCITLTGLMVAWLAWRMWRDRRLALFSALIYLTSALVYSVGTYAVLDPMISMWLMMAMCSFWVASESSQRSSKLLGYGLLGFACGMGVITKGFLALAVPVVAVLPWVKMQKRWREMFVWGWLAVFVCVLTVLPWGIAIALREPDYWHYFFWVQHIRRFAGENAQHLQPFWFYIPVMVAGSLPWLGLLPGALRQGMGGRETLRPAFYLLGWVLMPLLFFSISKGKLLTYILPCFAPLAILMARHALELVGRGSSTLRVNGWINIAVGLGAAAMIVLISPWGAWHEPGWSHDETYKWVLAAAACVAWALMGWLAARKGGRHWWLAACAPLMLALVQGSVVPRNVEAVKQPQLLISTFRPILEKSRYLLVNEGGMATGLAWELKRSDITLLGDKGELAYGLDYPGTQDRFVSYEQLPEWVQKHRQSGPITLVIHMAPGDTLATLPVPAADHRYELGRMAVIEYLPQPQ